MMLPFPRPTDDHEAWFAAHYADLLQWASQITEGDRDQAACVRASNLRAGALVGWSRMMTLVTMLLSLGGFACMALSMPKHYRQVFLVEPTKRGARSRRITAWLLLGVSLVPAVGSEGTSVGVVLWTGALTVSALTVTMLLTYLRRGVAVVAICALPSVLGVVNALP